MGQKSDTVYVIYFDFCIIHIWLGSLKWKKWTLFFFLCFLVISVRAKQLWLERTISELLYHFMFVWIFIVVVVIHDWDSERFLFCFMSMLLLPADVGFLLNYTNTTTLIIMSVDVFPFFYWRDYRQDLGWFLIGILSIFRFYHSTNEN